ncbi:MAG: 2-oxoglutarate dehydrogenase complex dihydrolipoyllysine-residue succinyltransferase [Gemmatimonadota bacterium]
MPLELKVPEVGESITEVEIGEWLKAEGDSVERDDPLVVIETDKITVELPAPASGTVTRVLKKEGEVASVGEVIGYMEESATPAAKGTEEAAAAELPAGPAVGSVAEAGETSGDGVGDGSGDGAHVRVSPTARRIMAEHGVEAEEVQASGASGRVLKDDVLRHLSAKEGAAAGTSVGEGGAGSERREEVVPMSPLRRRVAERLVQAQQQAALLTTFNEIDMSEVIALRHKYQDSFREKYEIKLGFMSFFVKAVIEALKTVPQLNAEVRGTDIVYRDYYDIGIAVGGGRGLVVPVLRDADHLSFAQVELAIIDLARRAQSNDLKLEELQGGTFTISNGGVYGSLLSTPIVNPPQSGILGLHKIEERPIAKDGEVVIRPMMYVAMSYDHRIVDGREAVSFLVRIKEVVEDPERILLEV